MIYICIEYIIGASQCRFRNGATASRVRLPRAVVEALKLKEGDDIEITIAGTRAFEVSRDRKREEALKRLRELSRPATGGI